MTRELVEQVVEEEYAALRVAVADDEAFDSGHWAEARRLFVSTALSEEFPDFLTIPAYESVLAAGG